MIIFSTRRALVTSAVRRLTLLPLLLLAANSCSSQPSGEAVGSENQALLGPPIYDSSCHSADVPNLNPAFAYGRIIANSAAFAECIEDSFSAQMNIGLGGGTDNGPYIACSNNAPAPDPSTPSASVILANVVSPNQTHISCNYSDIGTSTGGETAYGDIGSVPLGNTTAIENISFGSELGNIVGKSGPCYLNGNAANCIDDATYGWMAAVIYHEVMHTHGYRHPEYTTPHDWCGRPAQTGTAASLSNGGYNNSVPYMVGNCMGRVMEVSAASCTVHDSACGKGMRLAESVVSGSPACVCVDDPTDPSRAAPTYQALSTSEIVTLGSDGNLWLESGPFGTVPPARKQIDGNVRSFQAVDQNDVYVLGSDGKLWFEYGPFGTVPPKRGLVDANVAAFQPVTTTQALVLGTDGNLWLESAPWTTKGYTTRVQVDANVSAFQWMDAAHVAVLGTDRKLWIEQTPFGKVPPARQFVDSRVESFQANFGGTTVLAVLGSDRNLWMEYGPFNTGSTGYTSRVQVDGNVGAYHALTSQGVYVLGLDGNLWYEQGAFGTVPPAGRQLIDRNVSSFFGYDYTDIVVLGWDGKLWFEHSPWGTVPPARQQIDGNVAF